MRPLLAEVDGLTEKKMFGGLAFLIEGHMSVGVYGPELIVRIEPSETEDALKQPGVRMFDITGRPMQGWLLVSTAALAGKPALAAWLRRGVSFARSLPFAGQVGAALAIGRAVDRSFSCEVWYPGQRGRQVPLPRRPERLLDGDLEAALATRGTLETVQPRSAALQALDR